MRRRNLLLGIASLAFRSAARSAPVTPTRLPTIGYVEPGTLNATTAALAARFRHGLLAQGCIDGRNIRVISSAAEFHPDRLLDQAADLVHNQTDVIVVVGSAAALAARSATARIPIVLILADASILDALSSGSSDRLRSSITGTVFDAPSLVATRLELLREVVSDGVLTGFLVNSTGPDAKLQIIAAETAARANGVHLLVLNATRPVEIERAFATIARQRMGALLIADDPLFVAESVRTAELATAQRLPAIYPSREAVDAGGLLSYGMDMGEVWELCGVYAARILAGETPAELPVRQMQRTETAINLKTAKMFGIELRRAQLHADIVVE